MSILDLIDDDESFKYISLKEAICLLAEKKNSTIQDVAIYLLNKEVPQELACHTKGSDYKIKKTSGKHFSYGMLRPYGKNWAYEYLTNISESRNCASWHHLNTYNGYWENWGILNCSNIALLEQTYWYRQAFYNFESINSLNLFNESQLELSQDFLPIWDTNYLELQKNDVSDLNEIDPDVYLSESINFADELICQEVKKYPLFFKNKTFTLHEAACLISGHNPATTFGQHTYVHWLKANPSYEEASDFIYSFLRENPAYEYLDSNTHLGADTIKMILTESNIFIDGFNDILSVQKSTNFGQPSIQQSEPSIKNLNNEISELKKLIAEKDVKIKELESSSQKDDMDLISLIFDETSTERYAPDLAYSIKLWLDVYIHHPKADSHNSKANTWIKKNTPYNGEQDDTATRRVREIATPFNDLHISRKKLLEDK